MKYILKIIIFFLFAFPLLAQEEYIHLENEISALEAKVEELKSRQATLNSEINELAQQISDLKQKENLNIFQRRRLEGYLKSSQKLILQIENLNAQLISTGRDISTKRKQLINLYELRLEEIINQLNDKNKSELQKKYLADTLTLIKQKREQVQAKIDLEIQTPINMNEISQENGYTYEDYKEKADWMKDQEEKFRKNGEEIDRIVNNLQAEIEIREKMSELEQDISLFSHRDEPLAHEKTSTSGRAITGEKNEVDFLGNAYLQDALNSRSSLLPLFPNLSVSKDISNLSNLDIQDFIKELQKRKKQLISSADSLNLKAKEYYHKAEQAKKIERQD